MSTIPILTVFISGLFGLIVAIVTWKLASRKEKEKFKQEVALRDYKDREELYISMLSTLDMIVRYTKRGKDYSELFTKLTYTVAKAEILAPGSINAKFHEVSEIIYSWSSEYKQSLPSTIGDSGFGIASSQDEIHRERADKLFPELTTSINELVKIIKTELEKMKAEI
ncbi:MAG: hypothetical protein RIC95_09375 [Vicingaceae bacterium]